MQLANFTLHRLLSPISIRCTPAAVINRTLRSSPALLGKKYAKYYFTPKKIFRKEEIYRVPKTQLILPHERLDPLNIPEPSAPTATESGLLEQLASAVNHEQSTSGRPFAIVHLVGKQYKVSEGDLVQLVGKSLLAELGDELVLEKVLALGFTDFTLYGRPMLSRDCVTVRATVVEKTLEPPKIRFEFRKRQNFRRMNIHQTNATVLRIGSIEFNKPAVQQAL
ncbi:hypothetical protein BOX15_Mlig003571g2 [Macrostomum lignano]|uniref:Large ribosomal subunit protein bL21m n=1 Tax=Macrostomum lignano TaxID=282301 RepID=A0A267FI38_9PLAT|nr:hypothetical protein BOX15_Mlig003571g2 [Macrostomum lignano]